MSTLFKIDGSFVRDFEHNELIDGHRQIDRRNRSRARQAYGGRIGREDARLGRSLQELGVDAVQGYAYHRPEPLRLLLAQAA
jgi:EAL domain-containing protein (putative c-di-GMP-specific phosphodiesterase class I)